MYVFENIYIYISIYRYSFISHNSSEIPLTYSVKTNYSLCKYIKVCIWRRISNIKTQNCVILYFTLVFIRSSCAMTIY